MGVNRSIVALLALLSLAGADLLRTADGATLLGLGYSGQKGVDKHSPDYDPDEEFPEPALWAKLRVPHVTIISAYLST